MAGINKDFNIDELYEIFNGMIKKDGLVLSPEAEAIARDALEEMKYSRKNCFNNARDVHNLFQDTLENLTARLAVEQTPEKLNIIMPEDIPHELKKKESEGNEK